MVASASSFVYHLVQVLTGELPFRGVRATELGYSVVMGKRPDKPANASAIGFSDSLWGFAQRCWDGDRKLRPKVAEVVTHLERAAASWDGLMRPCIQVEDVASDSDEPESDSMQHCEFEVDGALVRSLTESQATSELFSYPGTPSTQCTDLSQEGPQEVVPVQLLDDDDLHAAGNHPHLNQHYTPPPSQVPQRKRKGFRHFKTKLRRLFGWRPDDIFGRGRNDT
jgi:hypothetical protein